MGSNLIKVGALQWLKRVSEWIGACVGMGSTIGGVSGTYIPLLGTIVGFMAGAATGAVLGLCVSWFLIRKSINRILMPAWGLGVAAAGIGVVAAWLVNFGVFTLHWSWHSPAMWFFLYIFPVGVFILVGGIKAWKAPSTWPPLPKGACQHCGYDLSSVIWRVTQCPECGTPPPWVRCRGCGYDLSGLLGKVDTCPECSTGTPWRTPERVRTRLCTECGFSTDAVEGVSVCIVCGGEMHTVASGDQRRTRDGEAAGSEQLSEEDREPVLPAPGHDRDHAAAGDHQ